MCAIYLMDYNNCLKATTVFKVNMCFGIHTSFKKNILFTPYTVITQSVVYMHRKAHFLKMAFCQDGS